MANLVPFPHHRRSGSSGSPRPDGPEPLWRHLIGEQLRGRRHEREETLGETAEKAGVSPQYLSEVERGRKEPSSEMIAAIAGALDLSLLDLTRAVSEELDAAAPASIGSSVPPAVTNTAFALAA